MLKVFAGNVGGLIRPRMVGRSSHGVASPVTGSLLQPVPVSPARAMFDSAAPPSRPPATRPPARRKSRLDCHRAMVVLLSGGCLRAPTHLHPSTCMGLRIVGSFHEPDGYRLTGRLMRGQTVRPNQRIDRWVGPRSGRDGVRTRPRASGYAGAAGW